MDFGLTPYVRAMRDLVGQKSTLPDYGHRWSASRPTLLGSSRDPEASYCQSRAADEVYPARARRVETREHIRGAGPNGACGASSWPTNHRRRESIFAEQDPMEPVGPRAGHERSTSDVKETGFAYHVLLGVSGWVT
eukprot:3281339-Pyramimonas_sp.AAC.1